MSKNEQEFSGKTLDDALSAAAKFLNVPTTSLGYSIVTQSGSGLLSKFFNRTVKIKAWIENGIDLHKAAQDAVKQALKLQSPDKKKHHPTQEQQQKIRSNQSQIQRQPSERATDFSAPEVQSLFRDYVANFLLAFRASDYEIVKNSDGEHLVQVNSHPELETILSDTDKLSCAFEHVFKRIAQKHVGDVSERVKLESGQSSENLKHKLVEIAHSVAEKVRSTGKTITLGSKTSQERRIIHLALEGFSDISTNSVGLGENRKLVVFLNRKNKEYRSKADSARKPQQQGNFKKSRPRKNGQKSSFVSPPSGNE